MRKKKRHLTPREIMEQCKSVARECRMANRTPWTAMGIMCAYTIMKREGFKGQRILKITQKIDEFEKQYDDGKLTIKEVSQRLYDKADWTIEHVNYTEKDIKAKKGTYQYWIDQKQIAPQNAINEQATRSGGSRASMSARASRSSSCASFSSCSASASSCSPSSLPSS